MVAVAVVLLADAALAQSGPFGLARPAPAPAPEGLVGWIMLKQAEFYRALSGALRAAKADGSAALGLVTLSFLYGVFHAAGPGHGKAVISSYLLANEATLTRGVALAFASAAVQAAVAVAVVAAAAIALGATARQTTTAVHVIETASYGAILALGLWLTWVKGRALIAALGGKEHVHGPDCGHVPLDAGALATPGGWRRAAVAVLAVGARPCSGAILVLVFALAQGVFWLGVTSTVAMAVGTALTVAAIAALAVFAKGLAVRFAAASSGRGGLVLRGLEVAGALAVAMFGALLLAGYMLTERMTMV